MTGSISGKNEIELTKVALLFERGWEPVEIFGKDLVERRTHWTRHLVIESLDCLGFWSRGFVLMWEILKQLCHGITQFLLMCLPFLEINQTEKKSILEPGRAKKTILTLIHSTKMMQHQMCAIMLLKIHLTDWNKAMGSHLVIIRPRKVQFSVDIGQATHDKTSFQHQ